MGCRAVDAQAALVRVTREGMGLCVDTTGRRDGRGAYVHADRSCLARAAKGGFHRSFRTSISDESITWIRQQILNVRSEAPSNE